MSSLSDFISAASRATGLYPGPFGGSRKRAIGAGPPSPGTRGAILAGAAVGAVIGGPVGAGIGAGIGALTYGIGQGVHALIGFATDPSTLQQASA